MSKPTVITKLKRNFVLIVMGMMTILLLGSFVLINYSNHHYNEESIDSRLQEIANRDGMLPQTGSTSKPQVGQIPEMDFRTDSYVAAKINSDGDFVGITYGSISNLDMSTVHTMATVAIEKGKSSGEIQNWRYLLQKKTYGYIAVFMDVSTQTQVEKKLFMISGEILALVWLVMLCLAIFLSRWVSRPVAKAFAAQTRFVADASHELKTPISVINANLAVLEGSTKKQSKWLGYIQTETIRMNGLVNSLLTLATMDDPTFHRNDSYVVLDDLIQSCVLPFESLMFESGIQLEMDCEKSLSINGDREKLAQMIRLLVENAVKHTKEGGKIHIELKKKGNRKIFSIYNEGDSISETDGIKIFERFYRADFARDRDSGGYGLGLSIARAIVTLHKGKIYADTTVKDGAKFVVEL